MIPLISRCQVARRIPVPPRLPGRRQSEFLAGRRCAAQALALAGHPSPPWVAIRPDGGPDWPPGFVGSISHSHDVAVAAVERSSRLRSIGIDVERVVDEGRAARLRHVVMTPVEERRSFREQDHLSACQRFTLAFSAKESLFKCLRPILDRWVEFGEVEMSELDAERGTFGLRIAADLSSEFSRGYELRGRFAWFEQHVLTAVELDVPGARSRACTSS
jgi:enterobactin synthetase component D